MDPFKTLIIGTPPSRTYTASATGLLTAANNLSDVADAATARENLGVGTTDSPTFASPTVTGTLTAAKIAAANIDPSSGTAVGRLVADPARADSFLFGANFNGGSQDDNTKPSWYASLDCRTASDQYSVVRIAPGSSPETAFAITTAGTSVCSNVATPAGGSTAARLVFGTTAGFGIYYGSGAPTVSAGQGSLYLRSDGSSTSTRIYVNTNGSTTWTNLTSAA